MPQHGTNQQPKAATAESNSSNTSVSSRIASEGRDGGGRVGASSEADGSASTRFLKRYRVEVAASGSSVLSTLTTFPLDSVKTRMQTYRYSGFLDCVRLTYQTEKLRGFFRGELLLYFNQDYYSGANQFQFGFLGVTAPMASITLVRTVSFSIYQSSKYRYSDWVKKNFGVDVMGHVSTPGSYPNFWTVATFGAAGATAGSCITLIACKLRFCNARHGNFSC